MDERFTVENLNLDAAERAIVVEALERAGTVRGAATLLGTTRFGVERRIAKHKIAWPRNTCAAPVAPAEDEVCQMKLADAQNVIDGESITWQTAGLSIEREGQGFKALGGRTRRKVIGRWMPHHKRASVGGKEVEIHNTTAWISACIKESARAK